MSSLPSQDHNINSEKDGEQQQHLSTIDGIECINSETDAAIIAKSAVSGNVSELYNFHKESRAHIPSLQIEKNNNISPPSSVALSTSLSISSPFNQSPPSNLIKTVSPHMTPLDQFPLNSANRFIIRKTDEQEIARARLNDETKTQNNVIKQKPDDSVVNKTQTNAQISQQSQVERRISKFTVKKVETRPNIIEQQLQIAKEQQQEQLNDQNLTITSNKSDITPSVASYNISKNLIATNSQQQNQQLTILGSNDKMMATTSTNAIININQSTQSYLINQNEQPIGGEIEKERPSLEIVDEDRTIDQCPENRFLKYDVEIGHGSFKTVYKGLDTENAVPIAWCELHDRKLTKAERQRFKEEAEMLKKLQHPNIVRFYGYWEDTKHKPKKIILITELMTSGTLKAYVQRFKKQETNKRLKVIKNFAHQILKGLAYLHGRSPPIIHRDLKCDNVFVTGQSGQVKIGDLGLATLKKASFAKSVIGTPEFMAPEMYSEQYDESIDVYAFGMCVLEMATGEYPYQECSKPYEIYKKVTQGIPPSNYFKLDNEDVRELIFICIRLKREQRPTVKELVNHSWFMDNTGLKIELCRDENKKIICEGNKIKFRLKVVDKSKRKLNWPENEEIEVLFDIDNDDPEMIAKELLEQSGKIMEDDVRFIVQSIKDKRYVFRLESEDILAEEKQRQEDRIKHQQQQANTTIISEPKSTNATPPAVSMSQQGETDNYAATDTLSSIQSYQMSTALQTNLNKQQPVIQTPLQQQYNIDTVDNTGPSAFNVNQQEQPSNESSSTVYQHSMPSSINYESTNIENHSDLAVTSTTTSKPQHSFTIQTQLPLQITKHKQFENTIETISPQASQSHLNHETSVKIQQQLPYQQQFIQPQHQSLITTNNTFLSNQVIQHQLPQTIASSSQHILQQQSTGGDEVPLLKKLEYKQQQLNADLQQIQLYIEQNALSLLNYPSSACIAVNNNNSKLTNKLQNGIIQSLSRDLNIFSESINSTLGQSTGLISSNSSANLQQYRTLTQDMPHYNTIGCFSSGLASYYKSFQPQLASQNQNLILSQGLPISSYSNSGPPKNFAQPTTLHYNTPIIDFKQQTSLFDSNSCSLTNYYNRNILQQQKQPNFSQQQTSSVLTDNISSIQFQNYQAVSTEQHQQQHIKPTYASIVAASPCSSETKNYVTDQQQDLLSITSQLINKFPPFPTNETVNTSSFPLQKLFEESSIIGDNQEKLVSMHDPHIQQTSAQQLHRKESQNLEAILNDQLTKILNEGKQQSMSTLNGDNTLTTADEIEFTTLPSILNQNPSSIDMLTVNSRRDSTEGNCTISLKKGIVNLNAANDLIQDYNHKVPSDEEAQTSEFTIPTSNSGQLDKKSLVTILANLLLSYTLSQTYKSPYIAPPNSSDTLSTYCHLQINGHFAFDSFSSEALERFRKDINFTINQYQNEFQEIIDKNMQKNEKKQE